MSRRDPAKPLTPREHVRRECRRRKRAWGSENEARLNQMRAEVRALKEIPVRWARRMTHELSGKRHLGNGTYTKGRRTSHGDSYE